MKPRKVLTALVLAGSFQCAGALSASAAVFTTSATEEAMVMSGSPTTVWDPQGATEISANGLNTANSGNSENALIYFNTAATVAQLNSQYGNNGWTVTSVGVTLYSNFPTGGVYPNNSVFNKIEPGSFTLSWLSNNGWLSASSGGVTWSTLGNYVPGAGNNNLQESQGTFSYAASGTSPLAWSLTSTADFLSSIEAGAGVTLYGTPADGNVGYLFNTPHQGNPAVLDLTVQAAPEAGSCLVMLASLGMTALFRRRHA